jgi:hypothetical protein
MAVRLLRATQAVLQVTEILVAKDLESMALQITTVVAVVVQVKLVGMQAAQSVETLVRVEMDLLSQ